MNDIAIELRKVTAVTTLKHLVPLETLEKWAKEAKIQIEIKKREHENKDNTSNNR